MYIYLYSISTYTYIYILNSGSPCLRNGLGKAVRFHDRHCLWWDPLWSLGLPSLLCALWSDALAGLFVAGALRWATVQHVTFAVPRQGALVPAM